MKDIKQIAEENGLREYPINNQTPEWRSSDYFYDSNERDRNIYIAAFIYGLQYAPLLSESDMTVQDFYSEFNLDFLSEEERQTIYTATELYAKGKLLQYGKEWVSVETKPEVEKEFPGLSVNVFFVDGGDIYTGYYDFEIKVWRDYHDKPFMKVTHWLPLSALPEPPIK